MKTSNKNTHEEYVEQITAQVEKCTDISLLDLIFQLLQKRAQA